MRKRRSPIHLTPNLLRFKASEWCKKNKNIAFDVPYFAKQLGLNPDSRSDYIKAYNIILYWRNKFIKFYYKNKKAGLLDNLNANTAWDLLLYNYNQNDAYVFLFNRSMGYFIQPDFSELEKLDKERLEKQWQGIKTVIDEMCIYDATLLVGGTQKHINELISAGKQVDMLLDGESKYVGGGI
jgi:hypothetical protein